MKYENNPRHTTQLHIYFLAGGFLIFLNWERYVFKKFFLGYSNYFLLTGSFGIQFSFYCQINQSKDWLVFNFIVVEVLAINIPK